MSKKFWTDYKITRVIKWWLAGAVYFFIAWGTQAGSYDYIYDLLFMLALFLFLAMRFIYMPIVDNMFDLQTEAYGSKTIRYRVMNNLLNFLWNFVAVLLIMLTYNLLNIALIKLFGLPIDTILVPGEPILFGVFYVTYTSGFEKIRNKIIMRGTKNEKIVN